MTKAKGTTVTRRLGRAAVTVSVVGLAMAAAFVGARVLENRAAAVPAPQAADLLPVAVREVVVQPGYSVTRRFTGQVEARAQSLLSFELGGRLVEVLADEGDQVRQGHPIARLDTALLYAEADRLTATRAATVAQLEFAQTRVTRAEALRGEGFSSQETLDQARAQRDELTNRIAEIDASRSAVQINIEKSVLLAPFDGTVGARQVDPGETLAAGQPVLSLLDGRGPQVRVGLPVALAQGDLETVRIDVAGQLHPAVLEHLRPDLDPVTRTRTAVFALPAGTPAVFGQTVALHLPQTVDDPGTWVPLDALQETPGGTWSVLTVAQDIVRPALVEVLHTDGQRAFVRGSFETRALLIATGAHRVVPGQAVVPSLVEG